jgi:D-amino-acid dehydrogenase
LDGDARVDGRADVAVIGGGAVGVACAWYLAERGARVVLVEQGELASGASYGNAGWIFPSHATPLPAPGVVGQALRWLFDAESPFYVKPRLDLALARWLAGFLRASTAERMRRTFGLHRELSLASLVSYEKLAKLPGMDFGFARSGLVVACATRAGLDEMRAEYLLLRAHGGDGELLDSDALPARAPALAGDLAGGVFYPEHAHVHPARFVEALGRAAAARGVAIRTRTEVLAFEVEGGRVVRALTTRGPVQAEQFVLAAGAWSPRLARSLRLRLPVESAKGYSLTAPRPPALGDPCLMLAEAKVGVTPLGAEVRFAGTLELAGLDLSVNLRRVRAIERAARRFLPELGALAPSEIWRGLRPLLPDDLPAIGRLRALANLIVATGHGMCGISQAPITGELVSELATGARPSLDLTPFSPDRF